MTVDSVSVDVVVVGLGALGSATAYQLAARGCSVVGLEQFALGHERGASHDSSRILRHSYHTPGYVRLTFDAYGDWADLEAAAGEALVTTVGGLDFFPPGAAIPPADYVESMSALAVPFEQLDTAQVRDRWPQFRLPDGTVTLYQERAAIVPAARATAAMQRLARRHGADLRDWCPATGLCDLADAGVEVMTPNGAIRARRVVLCTDAWANRLLGDLDATLPLTTTLEQVTYFAPPRPADFVPELMPLWIWMDDPSFYGFPCYGEQTVKAAEDCGGPAVDPDQRSFEPDAERLALLADFMAGFLPGSGAAVRSKTCLYTLTPDRDFALGAVPGHEAVLVGLGAAHGFKFAPTFGRLLADLATTGETGTDLSAFRLDRPALTEADVSLSWLV